MKKQSSILSVIISTFMVICFSGCTSDLSSQNATSTNIPAQVATIDIHSISVPTSGPRPTSTQDPEPTLPMSDLIRNIIPLGFFSYKGIDGYEVQEDFDGVILRNESEFFTTMIQGSDKEDLKTMEPEDIALDFLATLSKNTQISLSITGEPYIINVDNIESPMFPFIGGDFCGEIFVSKLDGGRTVFGVASTVRPACMDWWKDKGSPVFSTLIDSLQFLSLEAVDRGCQVSDDPTYGYSPENPIRVGGAEFGFLPMDGIRRENMFLSLLCGPDQEEISYTRRGSNEEFGTILDEYMINIKGDPIPKKIYIDIYNYSEVFAPEGFSCYSYFPFDKPR